MTGRFPSRPLAAEFVGTALLLAAVVGSGIMAESLAGGNAAIALLANSIATGSVLLTLIYTFGPISGAHFNPVVSIGLALEGGFRRALLPGYIAAQIAGALAGVALAHLMFDMPILQSAVRQRHGISQIISEAVATFGLLVVIHGTGRKPTVVPLTVAAYITAAYWFTASTSFANPAVTISRAFTDTFAGIRASDVPSFVIGQLAGGLAATSLFLWFNDPDARSRAEGE